MKKKVFFDATNGSLKNRQKLYEAFPDKVFTLLWFTRDGRVFNEQNNHDRKKVPSVAYATYSKYFHSPEKHEATNISQIIKVY